MQVQPDIMPEKDYFILQKDYEKLVRINKEQQQKITFLEHELAQLKRMVFGVKSERFVPSDSGQTSLWDSTNEAKEEPQVEQVSYARKKPAGKGKAVRTELPAHLPRQTEVIEPENLEQGAKKIGQAVTEILEYKPGKLFVTRYERPKYVQQEKIIIADLPSLPIPQGNAAPSLLSHLLISKFTDHLPFYRQVQMFKREGVNIAESTISGWFSASCKLLTPLYEVLKQKVQRSDYLHADETPLPVKSSQKKESLDKGYHWVYYSAHEKLVCFDYRPSRGREGPADFLKNFSGALQTDGYAAYEKFDSKTGITLLACMAHARRYFDKALDNDKARASYGLAKIQALYAIEREAKEQGLSFAQRKELRQKEAVPILDNFEQWLKENLTQVLPKSAIGQAIAYTLKLWPRLKRYTENGKWNIDNNLVENSIRPVALGRKNYLFAGSHQAAGYAAMMYSFLGTCKLNGVEPFEWLKGTLTKIPDTRLSELESLLPVK